MALKKTPFYERHLQNQGRMVDFAGWALPVEYKSMLTEAKQLRAACGICDASHMGEVRIAGKDAFKFLQRLTTNDILLTLPGQLQYNLFLNREGGVIDDFMMYNQANEILCVVNASNKDRVLSWFDEHREGDVTITDESGKTALISLQGPNSAKIMEKLFAEKITSLGYMNFIQETHKDKRVLISRSGYTGEDGFEVYIDTEDALGLWDLIVERGAEFGLVFCGLGARDILRIEAGYPLYGHEIDEATNPLEASLNWAVKFTKDFIGKDRLIKIREEGLTKKRVGFIMQERSFPREGYNVYCGGKEIGKVCSGTYSPNVNNFIGMAYIDNDHIALGTEIDIRVRDKDKKAKVSKLPFVEYKTRAVKISKEV